MAMAENLDDGEFWLPSQFLSDDETFESSSKKKSNVNNVVVSSVEETLIPSDFGYGGLFGVPSYRSSPFSGSSETESDEDEQQQQQQHQLAEFTRLTARSNLQSDFNNTTKSKGNLFSGSPQSTLCGFGSGCGMFNGSGKGSPNSVCNKVSSARNTWDLLHAAAGEVERMRLNQQHTNFPVHNRSFVGDFFTQQSLSHQQLQIAQFDMMRKQQMSKQQQQQNNGSSSEWGVYQQRQSNKKQMVVPNRGGRNNNVQLGLSATAWPSLQNAKQIQNQNQQQQFGSKGNGMRAVFLGGGRKESAGTGVFLPRPASESRKKPACSTALVPDRVMQALNRKKIENMVGCQQQHLHLFNASSNLENAIAAGPRHSSNYAISQQKKNLRPQQAMTHEIKLPHEWTY